MLTGKQKKKGNKGLLCYYIHGGSGCVHGDNCSYAHTEEEVTAYLNHAKTKLCKNLNNCKYGDKCIFKHPHKKIPNLQPVEPPQHAPTPTGLKQVLSFQPLFQNTIWNNDTSWNSTPWNDKIWETKVSPDSPDSPDSACAESTTVTVVLKLLQTHIGSWNIMFPSMPKSIHTATDLQRCRHLLKAHATLKDWLDIVKCEVKLTGNYAAAQCIELCFKNTIFNNINN